MFHLFLLYVYKEQLDSFGCSYSIRLFLYQQAPVKTSVVPRPEWPEAGKVEFDSYSVRYREGLDCVLKGITISIRAGEKVNTDVKVSCLQKPYIKEKNHRSAVILLIPVCLNIARRTKDDGARCTVLWDNAMISNRIVELTVVTYHL